MRLALSQSSKIEVVSATRAASAGFNILVLGGLATPFAATFFPVVGSFGLTLTALVAFVIAGSKIGQAELPALQGAVAALGSYVLVFPLMLIARLEVDPWQVAATVVFALLVGAGAGFIVGGRRAPVDRTGSKLSEPGIGRARIKVDSH